MSRAHGSVQRVCAGTVALACQPLQTAPKIQDWQQGRAGVERYGCLPMVSAATSRVGFWQNGYFFRIFLFLSRWFLFRFSHQFFVFSLLCEKVPRKILQENARQNPLNLYCKNALHKPFLQRGHANNLGEILQKMGGANPLFRRVPLVGRECFGIGPFQSRSPFAMDTPVLCIPLPFAFS